MKITREWIILISIMLMATVLLASPLAESVYGPPIPYVELDRTIIEAQWAQKEADTQWEGHLLGLKNTEIAMRKREERRIRKAANRFSHLGDVALANAQ